MASRYTLVSDCAPETKRTQPRHRRRTAGSDVAARRHQPPEQALERRPGLERPQSRDVGRGDVDHQEVGEAALRPQTLFVVRDGSESNRASAS